MSCVYVIICQDYLLVVMCVYDRSSILLPSSALRESFLIRLRLSMETMVWLSLPCHGKFSCASGCYMCSV